MSLLALPAFSDNYIWALVGDDGRAVIVDPGEAGPVLSAAEEGLEPAAILLTHHHHDHVGGVTALRERWPDLPVVAPHDDRIATATIRVGEGDHVDVAGRGFDVMEVPGHTLSHIAYALDEALPPPAAVSSPREAPTAARGPWTWPASSARPNGKGGGP